jgi:hypothetical protein
MDNIDERQQCPRCKEYEVEQDAYGIALVALAFIGPIIGIFIGLFIRKKLMGGSVNG